MERFAVIRNGEELSSLFFYCFFVSYPKLSVVSCSISFLTSLGKPLFDCDDNGKHKNNGNSVDEKF